MFRLRSVPFAYVFVILSTTLALAQFSRAPVDQQNELPVGQKPPDVVPQKLPPVACISGVSGDCPSVQ